MGAFARTGIPAPNAATPMGFKADDGTLETVSSANPFPISGTISASNPSVGTNGATAPASSTEVGWINGSGNLVGVSAANPLPIAGSFSASFTEATLSKTGSVSSAAVLFTQADTTGYYSCFFRIAGIGACTVVAEIENPTDGTWNAIEVAPVGTLIGQSSVTANGMYYCQTGGKGFRLRVSVYDSSSTVTTDAFFRGFGALPFPASFAVTQSGSWTVAATQSGTWNIGTVTSITNAVTVAQGTAANLNATVVGTGTFAVQAAQSGTWTVGLSAGSNLVGKVGIDQTTPGTTNAVFATNFPTTVDTNSGNKSASTLRVVLATDQPTNTNALKVDGSAVTQPVSGTVNQGAVTPVLKNGRTNSASSVVSSVAATLEDYYVYNPNASVAYVQIFDVATAGGVTVGTTTPKWSIGIPATSAANIARMGLSFASGIQVAATTTATGSTAPGTALDANFGYR